MKSQYIRFLLIFLWKLGLAVLAGRYTCRFWRWWNPESSWLWTLRQWGKSLFQYTEIRSLLWVAWHGVRFFPFLFMNYHSSLCSCLELQYFQFRCPIKVFRAVQSELCQTQYGSVGTVHYMMSKNCMCYWSAHSICRLCDMYWGGGGLFCRTPLVCW